MENYYGVTRSEEYLAHYGIKGMKWGVRKAIESGDQRRLSRQFAKAQKKLAKLEKRAASGKKYAARAAGLGAGAALAGTVAAGGLANTVNKGTYALSNAGHSIARAMSKSKNAKIRQAGTALTGASAKLVSNTSNARIGLTNWAKQKNKDVSNFVGSNLEKMGSQMHQKGISKGQSIHFAGRDIKNKGITNDTLARIGAGAAAAGLGGAAAYNAYRAATTKKAAAKADQFRNEMRKSFAGTQYARQISGGNGSGKKRHRK